jgi:hypothetical protein
MKMARASEADVDAALEVTRILDDLLKRYMPSSGSDEGIVWFDQDDPDQCQIALGRLLDAARKGSMFRVVFGMAVLLDPRNELLDPDADMLARHPKIVRAMNACKTGKPADEPARQRAPGPIEEIRALAEKYANDKVKIRLARVTESSAAIARRETEHERSRVALLTALEAAFELGATA